MKTIEDLKNEAVTGFRVMKKFQLPEKAYREPLKNKYGLDELMVGDSIIMEKDFFLKIRNSANHYQKVNNRYSFKAIRARKKVYAVGRIPVDRTSASIIRQTADADELIQDYAAFDQNAKQMSLKYGVSAKTMLRMLRDHNII